MSFRHHGRLLPNRWHLVWSGPCDWFCLILRMMGGLDPRIRFEPVRLPSQIERVHGNISVVVELAARPSNFHHISAEVISHAEMHPQIVAGEVTFAAADIRDATLACDGYHDAGADTRAIAAHSFRPDHQPVVS